MIRLVDVNCPKCGILLESNDKEVCKLCVRESKGLRNHVFRFYAIVRSTINAKVPRESRPDRGNAQHVSGIKAPHRRGQRGQELIQSITGYVDKES